MVQLAVLDKVKEELVINEDALSAWIKVNIDKSFFFKFDTPATVLRLREIINWAQYDSFYSQKAKTSFLKWIRLIFILQLMLRSTQ
jgi:hypothetical protein